ncbi:MAG: alpha-galactosidase [Clostridia bacterium]|nr:alpha-galactosidase [Clostridia bacterium]
MQISYEKGAFSAVINGKRLFFKPAAAFTADGKSFAAENYEITAKKEGVTAVGKNEGLAFTYDFTTDGVFLKVALTLENSGADLALSHVYVASEISSPVFAGYDMINVTGENMIGVEGIRFFDRDRTSAAFAALTDKYGNGAFLAGFADNRRESHFIETFYKDRSFSAKAMRDGVIFGKGKTLSISPLYIAFDNSLNALLSGYGDLVARDSEADFSKEPVCGWCDWYYYYGDADRKKIFAAADELKNSEIAEYIDFIQIDDGWNLDRGEKEANHRWGDWAEGSRFGDMKDFTDKLHEKGFKAGIWLAPFTASKRSRLLAAHPDWAVGNDGTKNNYDVALDLSNPEVTAFVKETFERVFNEWNFDYIKIDFLGMAMQDGVRRAREKTIAAYYHDTLKMIKEIANGRHVLTCGPAIFQTVGVTDSIRIGPDVGNRWDIPIDSGDQIGLNCSIKPCLNNVLRREWMDGRLFRNDPDCMMARHKENAYEKAPYGDTLFGVPWSEKILGLDDVTFDSWSKAIWFLSLPNVLSEVWGELLPERRKRIAESFLPPMRKIGYIDYYADPEVVALKTVDDGPLMIALFNMSDKPVKLMLPAEEAGGFEWDFEGVMGSESFKGKGGVLELPEIAPHAAGIWRKK